jgi:hypothetical protein
MAFEGLSSSVIIALAAVLWLVYLVPTWFRRREYLSTERNAVRLQQTLRILAETAEVPEQVRVENSARGAAAQEKVLQREMQRTLAIQRAQDAAAARAAARTLAETQPAIAADVARTSISSRRLRRSRLFVTTVLVAAVVGAGFGAAQAATGAGLLLLAASGVIMVGALVLLGQISAVAKTRRDLARGLQAPARVGEPLRELWTPQQQAEPAPEWTPVPIPKPLYLSRPEAPAVPLVTFAQAAARLARPLPSDAASADRDHAAELRTAAADSERALREAQQQTARLTPRESAARETEHADAAASASAPAPSRFARMGVLDDLQSAPADLDEALRRRRAV